MIEIVSRSERETRSLAQDLASLLKGGEILTLEGPLGSGKTCFVKGLAQGLGIKTQITSPTFVLMRSYHFGKKKGRVFYHFDLYRLKKSGELLELGFPDVLRNPQSIIAIEWPEKTRGLLPPRVIRLNFTHGQSPRERTIRIW